MHHHHHTNNDSRQQELIDAITQADTAHTAAWAAAHAATAAASEAGRAALAGMASAADAVEALGRVRARHVRTHWLANHMRALKTHLHLSGGHQPLEIDVVLFGMLRGERAVPDFAPGADDAPYRVAFLELAREHLFAHRQQVVRDFDVEWRADAAARRSTRRSARLLLLVPGSGATDDAPTSPSKRQRRGC